MKGQDLRASAVFGRVATLGLAYRIDVAGLLDRLTVLAPQLAATATVTVPHTFDRIAVATTVSPGGADRVVAVCGPEQAARLERLAGSETRSVEIEVETVPNETRLVTVARAHGNRSLPVDLSRLSVLGVDSEASAATSAVAKALGAEHHLVAVADHQTSWTLRIAQSNLDAAERDATRARMGIAAESLHATQAQRELVDGLHDTYAKARKSYTTLRVLAGELEQELEVMWIDVAWEHIVRMMLEFYPRIECSKRLGELSGAFDAEAAGAIELLLGPSEPPRMRISVALKNGRGSAAA